MTIDERIMELVRASEETRKASEEQRKSFEEQRKSTEALQASTKNLEATAIRQSEEMKDILASFREFRSDRTQMNLTMQTLIDNVNTLTTNVNKLEQMFNRSFTKAPNGKTE